ncbi:MAG: hypothetical protein ACOCRO_05625 [Halanaerobiales bacterium]
MKNWSTVNVILVLGIIFLVIVVLSLIAYSLISPPSLSPSEMEECNTIQEKGDIDIVFFSSKDEAEEYSETLLSMEPFRKYSDKFSMYYIDTYKPECDLYEGKALLCNSEEIIRKASSCPNDYIVVVKDKPKNIRSSSYNNIMSINSQLPRTVFPHEFAHSFANLADEYTPANLPRNSENCKKDCEEFENCFEGCSKSNYYRSIENGIMRSLSSNEYGRYNSKLIKDKVNSKKSLSTITGFSIKENCENKRYYLVTGRYDEGNLKIINKSREKGCVGEKDEGVFEYNLITERGDYKGKFEPSIIFTDMEENGKMSGGSLNYSGLFYLKVPIIEDSKKLEINKGNDTLSEINLEINNMPCKV